MQLPNILIIDYNLGNIFSVQNACKYNGTNTIVSNDKKDIESADAIILPGVGAFGDAMDNMRKLDLIEPIKDFIHSKKPFMGVCLGMQLLFTESEEFGNHKGLDIIKGQIKKFPTIGSSNNKIKVPQVGWNKLVNDKNTQWMNSPLSSINNDSFMYFVHSYFACPDDESVILSKTVYEDISYCSSILKDNIFATQFHPEKSAETGVNIYANWLNNIHKK